MAITSKVFGKTPSGETVNAYTLGNSDSIQVTILNLGGIIQSLLVPDKHGKKADVVCGYDTVDEYFKNSGYQGALIGRYANRIYEGKFTLNNKTYTLPINDNGVNCLHGGLNGFDKKIWNAETKSSQECDELKLSCFSPDGEEGFPGNLNVTVTYILKNSGDFVIKYHATTDKETPIAMTNHAYFNLSGFDGENVLNQTLKLNSDKIVAVNKVLIPTGLMDVSNTAFDFRSGKKIGQDISKSETQLMNAGGYDHTFIINDSDKKETEYGVLCGAALLKDDASGRTLCVYTDAPGVQVYTSNFLDGSFTFKNGVKADKHRGICLETGLFPDTPNNPDFPSCIFSPEREYNSTTLFSFRAE